jgi:hypothetical protein
LDRVKSVALQPRQFERPAQFDVLGHLAASIAILPREFSIEVRLETDPESAQREPFQAIGVLEPHGDAVLLRSQADDLNRFVRELARLPWPFEVLKPAELIDAVIGHAKVLISRHLLVPWSAAVLSPQATRLDAAPLLPDAEALETDPLPGWYGHSLR